MYICLSDSICFLHIISSRIHYLSESVVHIGHIGIDSFSCFLLKILLVISITSVTTETYIQGWTIGHLDIITACWCFLRSQYRLVLDLILLIYKYLIASSPDLKKSHMLCFTTLMLLCCIETWQYNCQLWMNLLYWWHQNYLPLQYMPHYHGSDIWPSKKTN